MGDVQKPRPRVIGCLLRRPDVKVGWAHVGPTRVSGGPSGGLNLVDARVDMGGYSHVAIARVGNHYLVGTHETRKIFQSVCAPGTCACPGAATRRDGLRGVQARGKITWMYRLY
jgi:hypothetical protein